MKNKNLIGTLVVVFALTMGFLSSESVVYASGTESNGAGGSASEDRRDSKKDDQRAERREERREKLKKKKVNSGQSNSSQEPTETEKKSDVENK